MLFAHLLTSWAREAKTDDDVVLINRLTQKVRKFEISYTDFLKLYVHGFEKNGLKSILPSHLLPLSARTPLIRKLREDVVADHLACMRSKLTDPRMWFDPVRYVQNIANLPNPPIQLTSNLLRSKIAAVRDDGYYGHIFSPLSKA